MKDIAIVSYADDLHALTVREVLNGYGDVNCSVVECNRIADNSFLHWAAPRNGQYQSSLPKVGGGVVHATTLDAIWWRRGNHGQKVSTDITNPAHLDLIENDSKVSLVGVFYADFHGRWVSNPDLTQRAENKLLQLRVAEDAGLTIPRTIVSQDANEVWSFCASLDHRVIIKAVRGTHLRGTLTCKQPIGEDLSQQLIQLCPTIYQEFIPGCEHIRAHCFGDKVYSFVIRSDELDWRQDLTVPIEPYTLPSEIDASLVRVLEILGLRMGIMDLKLLPSGEPIWLEVNPQGQFLFIQGITGFDLITPFAEFLYEEARKN